MVSDLWISILPADIIHKLGPLSLILIGYLVEKNVVGRVSVFANTLAINLHAFTIPNPIYILALYANIGIIVGPLAIIFYSFKESLPGFVYNFFWLYSSIVVGIIILLTGG